MPPGQILRLKCTQQQILFLLGSAPDPAGGACSVPPDSLAGFKGFTSTIREGRGGNGEGRGKGDWKEKGREERGRRKET